jgi:predicted Zn-ribbon and HTH transcriptional regulator
MLRRDLIPLLLDHPRTLTQIAAELDCPPREAAGDLRHLMKSLRHSEYEAVITPARCRKCDFEFGADKLLRPSRCPKCRTTWLAEPRIMLRQKP